MSRDPKRLAGKALRWLFKKASEAAIDEIEKRLLTAPHTVTVADLERVMLAREMRSVSRHPA